MISISLILVSFLIGCSSFGGILLGFATTVYKLSPEITIATLIGFLAFRLSPNDFSLNRWYSPYLYLSVIPLIFSWIYPPYIGLSVESTFPLIICCLISRVVQNQSGERILKNKFKAQLLLGLIIGFIVNVCFVIYWQSGFKPDDSVSFWTGQGRFGGFFTDPNAAAITSFLFLTLSTFSDRKAFVLASILSLVIAIASGGRSFFLAVGLWIIMWIGGSGKISKFKLLLAPLTVWGILNALIIFIPSLQDTLSSNLPVGLSRVLNSLLLPTMSEYLYNRFLFATAAISIFDASPLTGIGVGQFKNVFPFYVDSSIGTWTDNANNFYLGIIAEQGILGALFLFIGVRSLSYTDYSNKSLHYAVVAFLLLLLVGPHLEFLEVAILFGVILGQVVNETKPLPKSIIASTIPSALILMIITLSNERGLYPWERDAHGLFRWSKIRSVVNVKCIDNKALITLSTFAPSGLELVMRTSNSSREIFVNASPSSENFECIGKDSIQIYLTSNATWSPSETFKNSDPRKLSVMLRYHPYYD